MQTQELELELVVSSPTKRPTAPMPMGPGPLADRWSMRWKTQKKPRFPGRRRRGGGGGEERRRARRARVRDETRRELRAVAFPRPRLARFWRCTHHDHHDHHEHNTQHSTLTTCTTAPHPTTRRDSPSPGTESAAQLSRDQARPASRVGIALPLRSPTPRLI
jgi:hypothetical protein